mmetsp:Transcript_11451/g.32170  ORF Transcript_11451/g.32170 Transcript_11451/m.32170 type:complete len:212 (-) Transcript_11451:1228-1863(-)
MFFVSTTFVPYVSRNSSRNLSIFSRKISSSSNFSLSSWYQRRSTASTVGATQDWRKLWSCLRDNGSRFDPRQLSRIFIFAGMHTCSCAPSGYSDAPPATSARAAASRDEVGWLSSKSSGSPSTDRRIGRSAESSASRRALRRFALSSRLGVFETVGFSVEDSGEAPRGERSAGRVEDVPPLPSGGEPCGGGDSFIAWARAASEYSGDSLAI